jgi:surfactin synthase thioesterase subunit
MTPARDGDRWVLRFHPSADSEFRLLCFPHAGGAASYYFPLSQSLTPGIEVLAVQYPGRQDRRREKCIDNIPELADRIFEALEPWTGPPPAFFGHSMGAILAFEVARRLQQRTGEGPAWLFVSGRSAPSRQRREDVHLGDDADLLTELYRAGGTDRRVLQNLELRAAVLPTIRNDYRAIESYVHSPGPPLNCPVTTLVGDTDGKTTVDEASAWSAHTTGEFDLRVFEGGHFYLDAHRSEVCDTIRAALKRASRTNSLDRSTR